MNLLYPYFITKVYASGFFDDYPVLKFDIKDEAIVKANSTFGGWVRVLEIVYVLLITISVLSVVLCFGRMSLHAEDNPFKKEGLRHDLMMAIVMLAILGALPLFVSLVLNLLNNKAL